MKKVLIITYYWPPGSGAGVQRWLKFSKYLPSFGWEPVILTVDPDYAAYPAIDNSMNSEVPQGLKVYKTKATDYFRFYSRDKSKVPSSGFATDEGKGLFNWMTKFIRGNFFIPDPRKGWNRYAFIKACELLENGDIRNVITTSPPHSTQLIGLDLKKKYPHLKWIADLRDPWTDIYYYNQFHPTSISKRIDLNYEKRVLKSADAIITVGKSLKELFALKVPGISEKTEIVTNGYDAGDFSGLRATKPDVFTISYIGTLSDSYPLKGFLKALDLLGSDTTDFRLKFVGFVSKRQKEQILETNSASKSEFIPYADHPTAIRHMLSSSVLLLIIPDHHSNKSIITGKLFEYLASGKTIICLGPVAGDAALILNDCGQGKTFGYDDSAGILEFIKDLISNPGMTVKISPEIYSRENLVKKVVSLLS